MQRSFSHPLAPVDPRLDWTVGRRGVIFLDWSPIQCYDWIRNHNYLGSYVGKKWIYYLADKGSLTHSTSKRNVNNNYRLLKLSSLIL